METKVQKRFIDRGFGFPITLLNAPLVKVHGIWTPKINYNELALVVLRALAHKGSRLTGNEIKFIRTYFELTLQAFAKRFCVTHVAALKWEKVHNELTAMSWTTEKDIRLFILSNLAAKADELAQLYNELILLPDRQPEPIQLDAKKLVA
jgi:hypothetical protein